MGCRNIGFHCLILSLLSMARYLNIHHKGFVLSIMQGL